MTKMTVIVSVALVAVAIPSHAYCPTYAAAGIDKNAQILPDTYFYVSFKTMLITQCIEARPGSQADRYEYVVESIDQDIGKELSVCETPALGRDPLRIYLPMWGYRIIGHAPNRTRCGRYCSDALSGAYCRRLRRQLGIHDSESRFLTPAKVLRQGGLSSRFLATRVSVF